MHGSGTEDKPVWKKRKEMKAAIVGSGAWGTALAISPRKNGHDVVIWTFEKELIEQIRTTRENPRLPGVLLPLMR